MRPVCLLPIILASCTSHTVVTVPQESKGDVPVWFVNDSEHDLCDLRMAAVGSPGLGYSWLSTAETMFPDGESRGVRVHAGAYKMLAKSCDSKFEASNDHVEINAPTVISLGGHSGINEVSLQAKGAHANACVPAGGTCVALTPTACASGTVGDAEHYSCGGGLGVECCLPKP